MPAEDIRLVLGKKVMSLSRTESMVSLTLDDESVIIIKPRAEPILTDDGRIVARAWLEVAVGL